MTDDEIKRRIEEVDSNAGTGVVVLFLFILVVGYFMVSSYEKRFDVLEQKVQTLEQRIK